MHEVLTKGELPFVYKIIREIISMLRVDSGYSHNFGVNSWVFKDHRSETEAKTKSGHWVCPLLVRSLPLACTEHAQRPLLACRQRAKNPTQVHKNIYTGWAKS